MAMPSDRENLLRRVEADLSIESRLLEKVDGAFEAAAERAKEASRAAGSDADLGARFEAGLRAVLEAAAAQPDLARLCLVEAPGLGAAALERKNVGLQRFIDIVDGELEASNGKPPPAFVAEMVVGGIYEVMQRAARAGDFARMPALASQLRQLWLPALRGH
jgi:hypothetical protein